MFDSAYSKIVNESRHSAKVKKEDKCSGEVGESTIEPFNELDGFNEFINSDEEYIKMKDEIAVLTDKRRQINEDVKRERAKINYHLKKIQRKMGDRVMLLFSEFAKRG